MSLHNLPNGLRMPRLYSLTPKDVGLSSFDLLGQATNISPGDMQGILKRLADLDKVKVQGLGANTDALRVGAQPDPFKAGVDEFRNIWNGLLGQPGFVPPPGATPTVAPPPPPPAPQVEAPPDGTFVDPQGTGEFDFDEILAGLFTPESLAGDTELIEMQRQYLRGAMNAPDWNANYQEMLKLGTEGLSRVADERTRKREDALSAVGLRKSGQLVEAHRAETKLFLQSAMELEFNLRGQAAQAGEKRRSGAFDRAEAFRNAITSNNAAMARVIVDAQANELEAQLNRDQFDLQSRMADMNFGLERDRFTEEQRRQLVSEGFTDRQIDEAERNASWDRTRRVVEFQANDDVANRNLDIQESALNAQTEFNNQAQADLRAFQDGSLSNDELQIRNQDRQSQMRLEFDKIVNNNNVTLETRSLEIQENLGLGRLDLDKTLGMDRNQLEREAQELQRELGLSDIALRKMLGMGDLELRHEMVRLEKEKFDALQVRLEREFGLDLNRFALEETIRTGQLDLAIFATQEKFDLAREDQRIKWFETTESLRIQELLGMEKLELERYLGGEEISLEREKQALEKWMFSEGMAWDKHRFDIQLREARKKRKGGCIKSIIKTAVSVGAAILPGGGMLQKVAAAVVTSMGQGDTIKDIIDTTGTKEPGGYDTTDHNHADHDHE